MSEYKEWLELDEETIQFYESIIDTYGSTMNQNKIQEILGLNVNIQNKKNNSGKIIIQYKSLEQFELVSKLLRS